MLSVRTSELSLSKKMTGNAPKMTEASGERFKPPKANSKHFAQAMNDASEGLSAHITGWNSNAHVYTFCQPLAQRPLYNVTK